MSTQTRDKVISDTDRDALIWLNSTLADCRALLTTRLMPTRHAPTARAHRDEVLHAIDRVMSHTQARLQQIDGS